MRNLLLALLCTLPITLSPLAVAAEKAETQSQLDQLKKEISNLQGMLKQFKDERSKLQGDLRKSEQEVGSTEKRVRELQQQLDQQEQELQKMQQQRQQLEQQRSSQRTAIEQQVRNAYALGRQSKMKALLNQQEPATLSRALTYYDYFNRARAEQIDGYVALLVELDELQPQIESRAGKLRSARDDLDQRRRELDRARSERERALAKLNATIKSKDQEYQQLAQDRSALEAVLKKIERAAAAAAAAAAKQKQQQTAKSTPTPAGKPASGGGFAVTATSPVAGNQPFAQLRGQLPWPVAGKAVNRFGAQRGNSPLRWQGINIAAREGETVRAVHGGKVVFADWLRGSGLLLIVDHGGGFLTLYAHNQSLLRNVGDTVRGGDAVATVGNSGGQAQAGLYFEIRRHGVPSDPTAWCRRG